MQNKKERCKTNDSIRKRKSRDSETPNQREARRAADSIRKRKSREGETPDEREPMIVKIRGEKNP